MFFGIWDWALKWFHYWTKIILIVYSFLLQWKLLSSRWFTNITHIILLRILLRILFGNITVHPSQGFVEGLEVQFLCGINGFSNVSLEPCVIGRNPKYHCGIHCGLQTESWLFHTRMQFYLHLETNPLWQIWQRFTPTHFVPLVRFFYVNFKLLQISHLACLKTESGLFFISFQLFW